MTGRFENLLQAVFDAVQQDYEEARNHAQLHDPQRAGHEAEATWQRLISEWGPGWPVVTRKYIVGPGGESNEVDVVLLKPDYPRHLLNEASVLVSGVAAAFSCKLTFRRQHISETIAQKKTLLRVAGRPDSSVRLALAGPFPFCLLAHSSDIARKNASLSQDIQAVYEHVAHETMPRLVNSPIEELDGLLVADGAFLSTFRMSLSPNSPDPVAPWAPSSSFNTYDSVSHQGAPLAQFFTWMNSNCANASGNSLDSLKGMFGADSSSGYATDWPLSIYPEHILSNPGQLVNENRGPLSFG